MCGIVGTACFSSAGLWFSQETLFRQMLFADSLRGIDGAGIIRVTQNGNADWRKIHGTGHDLLRSEGVNKWLEKSITENDRVLIGHNRSATAGKRTTHNAHPFEHGHIVLVHNGFVSNLSDLVKKSSRFDVDSDGLAFAVFSKGITTVLSKLKGAYSIVYFDEKEKTLNFARNYERPMSFAYDAQSKQLVFASEALMLAWLLHRNNDTTGFTIKELPVHTLMTFDFTGNMTETAYEPPALTVYKSSGTYAGDNSTFDWEQNPETKIWERTTPATNPSPPPPPKPSWGTSTPNLRPSGVRSAIDQLFGIKRGDTIQFIGMEKHKSSSTQDQWCVIGAHPQHDNLEVRVFVKGESNADTLIDVAVMVEGTVRCLQRAATGDPIVFVSDPIPQFSIEETQAREANRQALLLLPPMVH